MKLKRNRMNQYHLRKAIPKKDSEGNSTIEYAVAESFMAEMWPGGGKVQAEMYGIRLPNIRNLRMEGDYAEISSIKGVLVYQLCGGPLFTAGDGICIYAVNGAEPDYKIVAMYPYSHLTLEVEKI